MSGAIEPGGRLGDLVIERELGRGAFAVVYLARDTLLERPVALKVLTAHAAPGARDERRDVLDEARLIARLASPHIVSIYRVHDLGAHGLAIEMEYMPGGSLADALHDRGALPVATAIAHARCLLQALSAAHEHNVIHRDVKPDNVLLGPQGQVKLADFGLGRRAGEASLSATHTQRLAGTPLYMAPEVVNGDRPTAAADVWSVGVILYEMLTGRRPFEAESLPALFYSIFQEEPAALGPDYPATVQRALDGALRKEPGARATVSELLRLLDGSPAEPPTLARPARPEPGPTAPEPAGRRTELAVLEEALAAAEGGRSTAVLVTGHAGIGKSTLLQATARRARARGVAWFDVTLTPLGGLARAFLASARRWLTASDPSLGLARITRERYGAAAPLLRTLLAEDGAEEPTRQQLVWIAENLLRGLASEAPLAWCIEDAHHADVDDIKVLSELIRRLAGGRVATFAAFRTDDPLRSQEIPLATAAMAELSQLQEVRMLELEPLESDDIERVLSQHLEAAPLAEEIRSRIEDSAEGNPLFAIELLRHLVATEEVRRTEQGWQPGTRWGSSEPPQRLREIVSARLALVSEEDRGLLDAASVDGVAFDPESLAQVLEQNLLHVLRALQRLQRQHRMLAPLRSGYRFRHALFREVVYAELAPSLRDALHRAYAGVLERRAGVPADPERLGSHWSAAGEPARARPYLAKAAGMAAARQQHRRAVSLLTRAGLGPGELTPERAREHVEVLLVGVHPVREVLGIEAVERIFEILLEAVRGDEILTLRTLVEQSLERLYASGRTSVDRAGLERALRSLPECKALGRAHYVTGILKRFEGKFEEAESDFLRAEQIWGRLGLEGQVASAIDQRAAARWRRGHLLEAQALYADAASVSERSGRQLDATISRTNRALVGLELGQEVSAAETLAAAGRSFDLAGARDQAIHTRALAASLVIAAGGLHAGLAALDDAQRRSSGSSYLPALAAMELQRGIALHALGRLREASEAMDRAVELNRRRGDRPEEMLCAAHALAHALWRGQAQERDVRALVASAIEAPPSTRRQVHAALLEASLSPAGRAGLCAAEQAVELGAGDPAPVDARLVLHLARGRLALERNDADGMLAASGALLEDAAVARRLAARLAACLFRAEAERRQGGAPDRLLGEGAAVARAAGHVWWELLLLRSSTGSEAASRPRAREILSSIGAALEARSQREQLERSWLASDS